MSEHKVTTTWVRTTPGFGYEEYNREHVWHFEGGTEVTGSAAPDFLGKAECVDPEQAFVASLSSCHMLFVLAIAAKKRLTVDRYTDDAVGILEKNEDGKMAVTRVVLRPKITFSGEKIPSADDVAGIHDKAHAGCFIANSVKTTVTVEPMG